MEWCIVLYFINNPVSDIILNQIPYEEYSSHNFLMVLINKVILFLEF